jgi:Skp family chaperone for outer membrane proteins
MSRSVLVVAGLALVVACVAIALPFALPGGGGVDEGALGALRDEVDQLQTQQARLRVATLNAEEAFIVFLNAVSDLRERGKQKQDEILGLQQQLTNATISQDEYQQQMRELQAELLDAQLTIDVGTLDRMIQSDGFSDMRSDLQELRDKAQPLIDDVKDLVGVAKLGVVDPQDFQNQYSLLQNLFNQFDQLLTQFATAKIVQVAQRIARQNQYDMVIRRENVIIYPDQGTVAIPDLTETVKAEISNYL